MSVRYEFNPKIDAYRDASLGQNRNKTTYKMAKKPENDYKTLIDIIGQTFSDARRNAHIAVNHTLVECYWNIGRHIVEFEQNGQERAEFGKKLLQNLAKDLTFRLGKGFSATNLYSMRQFFECFPISQTVSAKLSWSHVVEIISISDPLSRSFYEKQCAEEGWSVRQLKRQIESGLYQRLALSRDKEGVLALAAEGNRVEKPADLIRDPYVLEFLGLPEDQKVSEKELESKLIEHLQTFLLELGKGFTFVGRQFRITLDNRHFYVDLVFYHRFLRCFVLIDLKSGKVQHEDIGQMNMYLNYFRAEQNIEGDGDPVGIVLCADKHELLVEYALGGMSNQLFVSKYQLYFPELAELRARLEGLLG